MKGIIFAVILVALAVPALAQQVIPRNETSLDMKGRQAEPNRIRLDRGVLLHDPNLGNFRIISPLSNKGSFSANRESRLGGTERNAWHGTKGDLSYGRGVNLGYKPIFRSKSGAFGGLLFNRSSYFAGNGRKSQFTGNPVAHVPGVDSHVREELTYHFAWLGGAAGLQVKDPVAKDSWSLRMACRPKVKKESDNRYTAQVACYGRLGWSQQQLPVIVQFTLLGSDKKWKVHGQPTIVQANRITRPGQNVMAEVWAEELPAQAVETTTTATESGQ